jgi:hypothetical protein
MRNVLLVIAVLASGYWWGYFITTHPFASQIISGGIGLAILFILMVALYQINKGDDLPPPRP